MQTRTSDHVRTTSGTRVAGFVVLAVAALLLASPAMAGAADPEPTSSITITQTDSATQGQCLPGPMVLSYIKNNTSDFYELVVRASAPPCQPIEAKAASYAMPGKGEAWPQTLVEVVPFTISRAGTTRIRFTKTCEPMQFDVLTGATPEEIAPWGEWHGPLLFPLDADTSLQHWGWDCNEQSTTTTTEPGDDTTTTTEPGDTTTTTEPGDTTTTTEPDDTTTTIPTVVEGGNEERDPGSSGTNGGGSSTGVAPTDVAGNTAERGNSNLAYTGSNTSGPVAAGLILALVGMVLLVISRRRGALHN